MLDVPQLQNFELEKTEETQKIPTSKDHMQVKFNNYTNNCQRVGSYLFFTDQSIKER